MFHHMGGWNLAFADGHAKWYKLYNCATLAAGPAYPTLVPVYYLPEFSIGWHKDCSP